MIKIENVDGWGFEHAIRGMRNPMNSWSKSDSSFLINPPYLGPNDIKLMRTLYKGGSAHRKFLRQIFVSMDITAPLYWWKEFDTYKVGTVSNSCSTMHKIHEKEFTLDDFSHEQLMEPIIKVIMEPLITCLNAQRQYFIETHDKKHWWQMIQLLPSSYNQRRTVTMNYENVVSIIQLRTGHKLDEWNAFVEVLRGLPYVDELIN